MCLPRESNLGQAGSPSVTDQLRPPPSLKTTKGLLKVWLTLRPHNPAMVMLKRRNKTMPRIFTEEFKKDAVALVESGISQKQVSADL